VVSFIFLSIPAIIYALVVRLRERVSGREIASRLGLVLGPGRYYGWALGFLLLTVGGNFLLWRWAPSLMHSRATATSEFAGQPLTVMNLLRVLEFGLLSTGLGEELLFRGLLCGWLGRRMRFWAANGIQAAIFTLPHLLLLQQEPHLWPMIVLGPILFGLILGWLRLKSGSIFPGWIVHGWGNVFAALSYMLWSV